LTRPRAAPRLALAAVLVLAAGLAGCTGDDPAQETGSACRTVVDESSGHVFASVLCENAEGPGTDAATLDCRTPSKAEVFIAGQTTEGGFTVRVADADGATVYNRTFDEPGGTNVSEAPGEGPAGTWTVEVERSAGFAGTAGGQLACPTEERANRTSGGG